MIGLALKLVLAHILGDFLFQPDSWVKSKKEHKYKSTQLYWHIGIHALLVMLTLQFDFQYWLGMLIIVLSHFVIDLCKLYANAKMNEGWLFFIDQGLHLLVIGGVVYYYTPFSVSLTDLYSKQNLLLIVSLLLVTFVTSISMKVIVSKWKPEEKKKDTLKNAGAYIGMLERLFVFGFVVMDYWEGIGFLLAAKSVFRFGDLSRAKDRSLTEYILIGTLLSFGLAILLALAYTHLLEMLVPEAS